MHLRCLCGTGTWLRCAAAKAAAGAPHLQAQPDAGQLGYEHARCGRATAAHRVTATCERGSTASRQLRGCWPSHSSKQLWQRRKHQRSTSATASTSGTSAVLMGHYRELYYGSVYWYLNALACEPLSANHHGVMTSGFECCWLGILTHNHQCGFVQNFWFYKYR